MIYSRHNAKKNPRNTGFINNYGVHKTFFLHSNTTYFWVLLFVSVCICGGCMCVYVCVDVCVCV